MALSVAGRDVLSVPEFSELMRHLTPAPLPPAVTACWMGEQVSRDDMIPALDVGLRVRARDDRAHQLIDVALKRMKARVA
jgi:hypothetical protein